MFMWHQQAPKQQDDLPYWLVALLASLGALQTGYLTYVHPHHLKHSMMDD